MNSASDSWIHVHTSSHKKYTYTQHSHTSRRWMFAETEGDSYVCLQREGRGWKAVRDLGVSFPWLLSPPQVCRYAMYA